jgi:signal transduction histidine kinase/ABC-type amino acid transport substrate-binding protein
MLSSLSGCLLSAQQAIERPIIRAAYGDFSPYSFTDEEGHARGYSIDLTRQIVRQAGYKVEFVAAENPKKFMAMLARGEVDVTPLMALTAKRRAAGLASTPLGQFELAVYVRHDREIVAIEELAGRRIGAVVGAISQGAAELIPSVEVVEYQNIEAILLPILSGEVDAIATVVEPFEAMLRENYIKDKMRRLGPTLTTIPYGLIVRSDLPEVHRAIEDVIGTMVIPDALITLRGQWFGQDPSIVEHPWFSSVVQIVGGIGLATVALGFYAVRLRRRSVRLLVENGGNGLLIDALDQMRAGVVIFDSNMRAVHWNRGVESRFPDIVPLLGTGATIEQAIMYAYANKLLFSNSNSCEMATFAGQMAVQLRKGATIQRIVKTSENDHFDLSMFRLGTGHYAAIWVDVTQQHQQQERISTQSCELARKNQQLLAFSAMAAHDLKAPLVQQAALMEFIWEDIVDAKIALPLETQRHFATLTDLSRRMNILVSDLLDYAKADKEQIAPVCFAPDARLDAVVKLSGLNPEIKIDVMRNMPTVRVEPNAFDMVMRNLISNAIKHHDKPIGHIKLRAYQLGEEVFLEIEDDGPGIADKSKDRVFDPFCRLTKVEGTGLGLSFVKKTVASWGGSISLRSASVRGCIFQIVLPAAPDNVIALSTGPLPQAVAGNKREIIKTS